MLMWKRSICCVLMSLAAGCAGGGDASPTATATPVPANAAGPISPMLPPSPNPAPVQSANTAAAPAAQKPAAQTTALPTIPNGARYSIFCESYTTPDHFALSDGLKNLLSRNTKLKDWYVVHQANQSSLYHGYYAEFDTSAAGPDKAMKREADRARRDKDLIDGIPNPQSPDRRLFPRALFVPLDSPDPDAPPAWNLTNAPGYWTVQVAAFTGPDRKRQTLEAVKQARSGNIPAFYYHGPAVSSVCIGSWDRSAIKEQGVAVAGDQDHDPGAKAGGDLVVNMTGQELGKNDTPQVGPDGKPIRVLQSKIEVLDPTLLETLKNYPAQAVDGYDVQLAGTDKNGQKVMRTRPSMVVMIPRGEKNVAAANGAQTNEPSPTLLNPNAGASDLGARLRGIGQ